MHAQLSKYTKSKLNLDVSLYTVIHVFKVAGTRRPDGLQLLRSRKKKTWVWDEFGEAMEKELPIGQLEVLANCSAS